MAKLRGKMLKNMMEKLRRRLSLSTKNGVPGDVKKGHFAVHAINGGELQRFIVALGYLTHPDFLKLLKQAEEEFGFEQEGALVVPCCPGELQSILGERRTGAVTSGRIPKRWQRVYVYG